MSENFCLGNEVENTVLDVLEDVRSSVRTMEVYIALLLAYKCLVSVRTEELPCSHEVLNHADIGTGLDIEVTCLEVSADIKPRDQLKLLEPCVCSRTL